MTFPGFLDVVFEALVGLMAVLFVLVFPPATAFSPTSWLGAALIGGAWAWTMAGRKRE